MKLKIPHKLFLTILLSSSLIAGGLFFFLQLSFDRGFLNYVNSQEMSLLRGMVGELATLYSDETGWGELQDNHHVWMVVQRRVFATRIRDAGIDGGRAEFDVPRPFGDKHPPPPPIDGAQLGRRIALLDGEKNRVIGGGPDELKSEYVTLPIEHEEKGTIGYLAIIPVSEISGSGELLFVKQQKTTFAIVAVAMLGISLLLTFPLTVHLLRPINSLTRGTEKLIGGHFSTRIPITSGDELGRLSNHFNILAMTLEKNEAARKRWIADISHELRTPLAVLRGELEAVLDGVRALTPENLEPLHSEILHMQRLVGDLYELSMSDIGALSYKKVPVDIVGLLTGAVEQYEKRYEERQLKLLLVPPKEPPQSLLGDPDRLQQLFVNLLENSVKYTHGPGLLEIRVQADQDSIVILFDDSEPGVTDEQRSLLFERLYRADPSRHRADSGAGLGLAICNNITQAHGGTISASTSPHGGVGIRIELPLTD